jgi:uncharacterized protein YllA (UPF0747 family)
MFSPNVIMRPLYQEVILPNLVTLAEAEKLPIMELKSFFDAVKVTFPMLLVHSVLLATEKQIKRQTN